MIELEDVAGALCALRSSAEVADAPLMLVGAYARDMRLEGTPGTLSLRRTRDVDVAVMVKDWEHFGRVRHGLLSRPERDFAAGAPPHRMRFRSRLEVDIVPFGAVMDGDGVIRWPPDGDVQMSVLGFEDAYDAATEMALGGERLRVVTLPGLVLLKLMAWNDDPTRTKDAEDIAAVVRRYLDVPSHEGRLWQGQDSDLVEVPDFDYEAAGARLVGRDLARIVRHGQVRLAIEGILGRETERPPYDLAAAMAPSWGSSFEAAIGALRGLRAGIEDIPQS